MGYRAIGVEGVGHWAERLGRAIDGLPLRVTKLLDIAPYDQKRHIAEKFYREFKVKPDYTQVKPSELPSADFYQGLDMVQVASPVAFHGEQTLHALHHGVPVVVTEKAFGVNRQTTDAVMNQIDRMRAWDRTYLHLHYLKKRLTEEMPAVLESAVREHGKVKRVDATFIEQDSHEDRQRCWLLDPKNGGIVLDWVHPFEVLVQGASAKVGPLQAADGFIINPEYSDKHPTAARALYELSGPLFSRGAEGVIRVGKGFPVGSTTKTMRFTFDDDVYADFNYVGTGREATTNDRGHWMIRKPGVEVPLDIGVPRGRIAYTLMLQEVLDILEDDAEPPLGRREVTRIFDPVWSYNELMETQEVKRGDEEVALFLEDARKQTRTIPVLAKA